MAMRFLCKDCWIAHGEETLLAAADRHLDAIDPARAAAGDVVHLQPLRQHAEGVHRAFGQHPGVQAAAAALHAHAGLFALGHARHAAGQHVPAAMALRDGVDAHQGEEFLAKLRDFIETKVDGALIERQDPAAVFVYQTCVTGMIGDDIEAVAKAAAAVASQGKA